MPRKYRLVLLGRLMNWYEQMKESCLISLNVVTFVKMRYAIVFVPNRVLIGFSFTIQLLDPYRYGSTVCDFLDQFQSRSSVCAIENHYGRPKWIRASLAWYQFIKGSEESCWWQAQFGRHTNFSKCITIVHIKISFLFSLEAGVHIPVNFDGYKKIGPTFYCREFLGQFIICCIINRE